MQRSRLKNIINKSRELSNNRDPFDSFKDSLPTELDYYKDGGKYRLKAAWEAYGKPKNLQEAQWNGLVENINGKSIMPSIGYNESLDRYEYLNTGKDNDIVNKDIRAWDNNVIPFIQELKSGGFIKSFNEEENCWIYCKEDINSFKEGGNVPYKKEVKIKDKLSTYKDFINYIIDTERNGGGYDYEGFWNDEDLKNKWFEEEDKSPGKAHFNDKYKLPNHYTFSTDSKFSNSVTPGGQWSRDKNGKWTFTTSPYVESQHSLEEMLDYFKKNEPDTVLIYKNQPYFNWNEVDSFKNGGQMNIIPEGALHARKNNMEGAGKDFTAKGIPVLDNGGEQKAEIEKEEWTMTKELTDDIESWYKKYYDEEISQKDKDELAIKCGKRICKELLHNTDDRAGLIDKILKEEN